MDTLIGQLKQMVFASKITVGRTYSFDDGTFGGVYPTVNVIAFLNSINKPELYFEFTFRNLICSEDIQALNIWIDIKGWSVMKRAIGKSKGIETRFDDKDTYKLEKKSTNIDGKQKIDAKISARIAQANLAWKGRKTGLTGMQLQEMNTTIRSNVTFKNTTNGTTRTNQVTNENFSFVLDAWKSCDPAGNEFQKGFMQGIYKWLWGVTFFDVNGDPYMLKPGFKAFGKLVAKEDTVEFE